AMMLQIGHRESHDVDIFLPDAQFLPFLDPKLHDFEFEIRPSDYGGDGAGFFKLAFEGLGEIDFIVAHAVTDAPTTRQMIKGEEVDLETVAEIIAKKIHYRGATIKPRDIFDIAAAARHNRDSIISSLKHHKGDVAKALSAIERLKPDFVNATIAELAIRDSFKPIIGTALVEATALLESI
ncbi:MAG: nucleotidyl transferase AbiEii/AbiGii toxin family protein, partial [Betaproteobacteria bacterium]|nr:nucleotidyl transferase AbiEii/AbiGii toxin family protein [Betaproteobacteria bacterium]